MKLVWKIVGIVAAVLFVIGLALVVVSLLSGGGLKSIRNNVALTNYDQSFPDAAPHTLELSVGAGKLYILPGDELRVEAKNVQEQGFICQLEQGVLTVREDWSASWADNLSRWMSLRDNEPEIYVYLPADYSAQIADIQVAAGFCRAEGLTADYVKLHVAAGSLELSGLTAGQTEVDVDAGGLYMDGLDTQSLAVELSAGSASISGSAAVSCVVDVAAGSAELTLAGTAADYTADIDAGAGSITYDGRRFNMQEGLMGGGAGVIELDCAAGSISLRFAD